MLTGVRMSLVLIAVLLVTASPAAERKKVVQKDSLEHETLTVASTELRIGMAKDKVLSLLAQDGFQIVPGERRL